MKKPFQSYFGGKEASGIHQQIINIIPPHSVYIEPFLGNGTILQLKKPALHANIGMDRDPAVVSAWAGLNNSQFTIILGDAIAYLKYLQHDPRFNTAKKLKPFIYIDPPYPMASRKDPRCRYTHEMTDAYHTALLEVISCLNANIAISTYLNGMYNHALRGWNHIEFQAKTRGGTATEMVYFNYDRPTVLHDYRFVGDDYRDRERIKKATDNMLHKLSRMPIVERNAILTALAGTFDCPF